MRRPGTERGFSLIELMIVVAILGLCLVVIERTYLRWSARYKADNALKNLHAAMMDARGRAMTKNRFHFVSISGSRYRIFADTSPQPEGDRDLSIGADAMVSQVDVAPLTIELWRDTVPDNTLAFRRDGTADAEGKVYIRLRPGAGDAESDYDCIEITPTRLKPGKMNGTGTTCAIK